MSTKVNVGGKEYSLTDQQKDHMKFFTGHQALTGSNVNDIINLEVIDINQWELILSIGDKVGWKFPNILKVSNDDLKEVLGPQLAAALEKLNYKQINALFQAADYLQFDEMKLCVAARLACEIYMKKTYSAFKDKMQKLGIKENINSDKVKKMHEDYPFINAC